MGYYRICANCGAHLDPEEKCLDCRPAVIKIHRKRFNVEALKWTGVNHEDIEKFLVTTAPPIHTIGVSPVYNFYYDFKKVEGGLIIKTLEGEYAASIGDYILKGVAGEFYPCKPDIFIKSYILKGD